MSDYGDENVLGVGTLSYATETRQQPAPRQYVVELISRGKVRDAYEVAVFSVGGKSATVYHNREHNRFACGTHGTADVCVHSAACKQFVADTAPTLADTSKRVA